MIQSPKYLLTDFWLGIGDQKASNFCTSFTGCNKWLIIALDLDCFYMKCSVVLKISI